jgi:hypothetical protein
MNADWHKHYVMPKNATLDQRDSWHIQHVRHCACRPIPESLMPEIEKQLTSKQFKRLKQMVGKTENRDEEG